MKAIMKLAYIIYNERPISGLIRTQVYSLLKEIARQDTRLEVELIAFWQPWVAWRYRQEIRKVRADLHTAKVRFLSFPWAFIPSRYFLYNTWLFSILCFWVSMLFYWTFRRKRDIVHCRGYLASFVAARLGKTFGHKTVFDMRSLWPKEHLTIGAWRETDSIYQMWRRIEAETLSYCDAAVGVSKGIIDEIALIAPEAGSRSKLIPIAVDTTEFCFDNVARSSIRTELGWQNKKIIVYQGSLGLMNSNLAEVAGYFEQIAHWFPAVRFLILTSNTTVDIPALLDSYGLARERYVIRHPRGGELAKWLSAADAGIHAMSPGPDSGSRLGVKVVEYLSCGLPIIVNPYVGAAVDLVHRYGVGIVLDLDETEIARRDLENLFLICAVPHDRSRQLALDRFSVVYCAQLYCDLYKHLGG